MQVWQAHQGVTSAWQITARDENGDAVTGYTGSEALAATVRLGRDQAALFSPAVAWSDAPNGVLIVTVAGASTVTVAPGSYLVQVKLADGSADLFEGFLLVEYSPGSAAPRTTYVTLADVVRRAKFVEPLLRKGPDPSGLEARADAWDWMRDLLHRHYRGGGGLSRDYYFLPWPAYSPSDPSATATVYRPGIRSLALEGWINTGGPGGTTGVILTTPVSEALADYAVAKVCEAEIGPKDNGYERMARKYLARAENQAASLTVEIDTNGDGLAEVAIRLGVADTLYG